jgi:hypothetical protein
VARRAAQRTTSWLARATREADALGLQLPAWGIAPAAARAWMRHDAARALTRASERELAAEVRARATLWCFRTQPRWTWRHHLHRCREVPQGALREWLRARAGTGRWAAATAQYHSSGTDACPFCPRRQPETILHHLFDCCATTAARGAWLRDPAVLADLAPPVDAASCTALQLASACFNAAAPSWAASVRFVHAAAAARRQEERLLPEALRQPWGTGRRRR